jgi:hypothetical protein
VCGSPDHWANKCPNHKGRKSQPEQKTTNMVGMALLTSCYVLNRVLMKNKEKTPYEKWIGRKPSLSYLCTWVCLTKFNVPINKKRKLSPKIVDCVFWGYAHHSIAYRFLVIKLEVPDVHVDTFLEYRDVNFFKNIFL